MPRQHKWTQDDIRIHHEMKMVGFRNLKPKDKKRMQQIFTYETGLP